jgi:SAM-dependent methyltransferase
MTLTEYRQFADNLAKQAQVVGGIHGYYLLHHTRLWQTASHFNLWDLHGKTILEIGPFYSYTPFLLEAQCNEVCVLEGDDPVVYPLRPLYAEKKIPFTACDLVDTFGSPTADKHRLPYGENQFDLVCSWETLEHFNFNPVGFVRDLYRVLKPGGLAFVTVPNVARLENRVRLLFGKGIGERIGGYNQFYNYAGGNFLGFHWREYAMAELVQLFGSQNFSIISADHLLTFQNHPHLAASRKIKRLALKAACAVVPSCGTLCAVVVRKPA